MPLDKNNGLRAGNIKTLAAGTASQHVINAHHVVARILKLPFVMLTGASWRSGLLGALQPANFVVVARATVRTAKASGL